MAEWAADRHGRALSRQALTERDADRLRRPRAKGVVTIESCRTPMRATVTGRTQAEGFL